MNQLKVGAILSYVVIGVNMIAGLVYTPYMLRMLGQSEYGLYSLATSVIAYLTVLDLGFANAIIRYTAKFRAEGKKEEQWELFGMFFRLYLGIGIVAFIIGLIFFFNVGNLFGHSMTIEELATLRVMMMLMSFNLAITFPLSIFGAIILAYENFIFQKVVNLIRVILNPLVMVLLLCFGYKAIAMVIITTIFNLVTLSLNCFFCFQKLHVKIHFGKFNMPMLKEISVYSVWIFLYGIMDRIYWSTGQFILGVYRGTDTVAIYAIAILLKNIFFQFSTAISGMLLPRLTTMVANNARDIDISNYFIKTGRIQFIIMGFILSAFIVFGKCFIGLWAGSDYEDSFVITLLLFVPAVVPLIQNVGLTILQARNQQKFSSLLYVSIAIVSVFFSIPLAKQWGGVGCAIATSAALTLGQVFAMNFYYYKIQNINIIQFWKEILKMAIIPISLCSISCFVVEYYPIDNFKYLIIGGSFYTTLYIPLFWFFSLNDYERNLFGQMLKKVMQKINR